MPFELPREEMSRSFRDWANSRWEDVYMRPSIVNKSRALCRSFAPNKVWYTGDMEKTIDPGIGYRLLVSGDKIVVGDQYWSEPHGDWLDVSSSQGKTQGVGGFDSPRRRKITKKRVEVTSGFKRGDIAVLPSGEEVKLDVDGDIEFEYHWINHKSFERLSIKVYREVEPRCYPQEIILDGSTHGISLAQFKKGDRIWISNKEPLTFKEED